MASCFFQGASCPERVSWPLSCGVGCLIEAEKGGGQKFLPRRTRVPWQVAFFKGLAAQRTCPGLCPVAWGVVGPKKAQAKNSYRSVIGFQSKWFLSRGWLLRARVLASVLWRGAQYRGWERHRSKFLSQRSRFPRQTASFKGLAAQSACLASVLWRGARYRGRKKGGGKKNPTAAQ